MDDHHLQLNECRYHALKEHARQRGKPVDRMIDEAMAFYGVDPDDYTLELMRRGGCASHAGDGTGCCGGDDDKSGS